jgi:dolichol-phosphate mannosyltransferase
MFSLVIPTYNEADNIFPLLDKVTSVLEGLDFEVIVVDDDSPDKTYEEVIHYRKRDPRVRCIVRKSDKGLSSAVIAGFERAKGKILGVMDADLSHDPRILPKLIKACEGESDLAIGVRSAVKGWGLNRKLISKGAKFLAKFFAGVELSDPMSGYFCLKRDVFERVKDKLNPIGYKILLEIYVRAMPLRVTEVPFVFVDRVHGESKLDSGVIKEYLKQLFDFRSNKKDEREDE